MSEQSFPQGQRLSALMATRRQVLRGLGIGTAAAGLTTAGIRVAGQEATPGASPEASPAASPQASPAGSLAASPVPPAVPETSLTIVREQRPEYAGTPGKGTDLRLYARSADLHNFSPTAQRQDFQALVSLLDPLVWIDEVTMEPEPWLATSWEWSADGLTLTFQLRDDVIFHNGTPLTAEDVRFSFEAYRDDYDSAMANFFALITDVTAEGEHTVRVAFAEPDGAFLYNGASQPIFSSAQYKTHWESKPVGERSLSGFDWAKRKPLGTGPWQLAGTREDFLMFGRFDGYWNQPPHFDRLKLIAEDDLRARLEGWKAGEVDMVSPVRATDMGELWGEEGTLFVAEAPVAFFAAFNFVNPANATPEMMRDSALRRALTLAVDRERYAREIFFDFIDEKKAGTITQPWAHEPSVTNPDLNVDEANRILDEGGWGGRDRNGLRMDAIGNVLDLYCIVSDQERPELRAILGRLNEDFGRIGARLTVQELDPAAFDERWVENRMYDMAAFSVVQYPAFAEYDLYGTAWDIRSNRRGWNPGGYSNQAVDAAIEEYFNSWTQEDMKASLEQLQIAAGEDLFGLWFGFPHDLVLVRPDIQGFVPHRYFQTWNTRALWRGAAVEASAAPSPEASPDATPGASPVVAPGVTPDRARPGASPAAPPIASPMAGRH